LSSNSISSRVDDKNVPLTLPKNVPTDDLVHRKKKKRGYVKREKVRELCKKKYDENGSGITFLVLMDYLNIKKRKAQRLLKHLHMEKVLFTAIDLQNQGIKLNGFDRKNPQKYYLTEMRPKIIEDNKKMY
jgi:predicted metal-dependent hydrolase